MSKIDKTLSDNLEKLFTDGITEKAMERFQKDVRGLADGIMDDMQYRIQDELAMQLTDQVRMMAERAVEAMLSGNENEFRRWLSCDKRGPDGEYIGWTGRSDGYGFRETAEWHPVIHGKLHENHTTELRKRVAQANEALLRDERILDLEDQIKSLVAQVNKANAEREAMWQRLRDARVDC